MKRSVFIAAALLFGTGCSKGVTAGATGTQGPQGDPGPQGPQGPQGTQGPEGVAGPVGMNWKGAWNITTAYAVNDAVQAGGGTFLAISASTGSSPPGAAWSLVAAGGSPGSSVVGSSVAAGALCAAGGVRYSSIDGDHYVCNGVPGLVGSAGAQGATGANGAVGASGANGSPGMNGVTGATGVAGAIGATGPAGPAGQISGVLCPTGQYLRGIDASGGAICAAAGDVAAPIALEQRLSNASNKIGSGANSSEWEATPGFAVPFISAGGPVQIIPNLSMYGGSTTTCRPMIDGQPSGLFDGQDTSNIWQDGLLFTGNLWGMWSAGRAYPNVPPGRHLVTLQCKEDSATATNINVDASIATLSVIPYGDPATAEVKAFTASGPAVQNVIGCCAFGSISGLTAQFNYQGGPVRISLNLPLSGGSHATCRPLIDGSPAGAEPVDTSNVWNEGLAYVANGWVMWTRTRVYDPSTFATPLAVGLHSVTVECRSDQGSVTVGTTVSSGNITVVTYKPAADPATTVHAYRGTTTLQTSNANQAWAAVTGLSTSFTSNGGPVELGLSLPLYNTSSGSTNSCRPLVDGTPITLGEPDVWSNTWNGGLQGTNTAGWWQMWNQIRMYRGIAAGTHALTAQCFTDTGTLQIGNGSMVESLFAVAYDQ